MIVPTNAKSAPQPPLPSPTLAWMILALGAAVLLIAGFAVGTFAHAL